MNLIIGIITVVACTLGGYAVEGGHLEVLARAAPLELVIMGGTAAGGFIIGNPSVVIRRTGKAMGLMLKKAKYNKASYIELLCMLYQLFKLAKTKGLLALEQHIENPEQSSLFANYPNFLHDHHAVSFLCDYLRLVTLGSDKPYELEALMDEELEVHHGEDAAIVTALTNIADGMPAIGIVAAVLGVIHTMGSISEPPEVLGELIGGALVGTFMGVWTSYGMIGPMANSIGAILAAQSKYLQCIKVGLLAHLQGFAPSISVEYARKTLLSEVRPSFSELEEATSALPPPTV
ncbi:MAG: flagellar motor stator protein MotA [Alphaproteobacteria bacterium]|nr:flagellar motor stator protein MotA [Alphaproteobacteria bacterium]